eukprot:3257203-Rhodomonas_salina.3
MQASRCVRCAMRGADAALGASARTWTARVRCTLRCRAAMPRQASEATRVLCNAAGTDLAKGCPGGASLALRQRRRAHPGLSVCEPAMRCPELTSRVVRQDKELRQTVLHAAVTWDGNARVTRVSS